MSCSVIQCVLVCCSVLQLAQAINISLVIWAADVFNARTSLERERLQAEDVFRLCSGGLCSVLQRDIV